MFKKWILILVVAAVGISGCSLLPRDSVPTAAPKLDVETVFPKQSGQGSFFSTPTWDATRVAAQKFRPTATPANDPRLLPAEIGAVTGELVEYMESPHVPRIILRGNLPSDCVQFRVEILKPDAENQIALRTYGLLDPGKICTAEEIPYVKELFFNGLAAGSYRVLLNTRDIGEINYP